MARKKTKTPPKTPSVLRTMASFYKDGACHVLMGGVHIPDDAGADRAVEAADRVIMWRRAQEQRRSDFLRRA